MTKPSVKWTSSTSSLENTSTGHEKSSPLLAGEPEHFPAQVRAASQGGTLHSDLLKKVHG